MSSSNKITLHVSFDTSEFDVQVNPNKTVDDLKYELVRDTRLPDSFTEDGIQLKFSIRKESKKLDMNIGKHSLSKCGIVNESFLYIYVAAADTAKPMNCDFSTDTQSKFRTTNKETRATTSVKEEKEPSASQITSSQVKPCSEYGPKLRNSASDYEENSLKNDSKKRSSFATTTPSSYKTPTVYKNAKHGICGLENIGNTCFMNSAIQCISNVDELSRYFWNNDYFKDLNYTNPLGMNGKVANAYGELIQNLWSGKQSSFTPSQLKREIARFAPQFADFRQQDSQEFMNFLLDALHEDLKDEKKTPILSSKIAQLFHFETQSIVICPYCKIPVNTVNTIAFLPLPIQSEISMEYSLSSSTKEEFPPKSKDKNEFEVIHMKPNGTIANQLKIVPRNSYDRVRDLIPLIVKDQNLYDCLLPTQIANNQLKNELDLGEHLCELFPIHPIVFYELTGHNKSRIQCHFVKLNNDDKESFFFRLPMFLNLQTNNYDVLHIKQELEKVLPIVLELSPFELLLKQCTINTKTDPNQSFKNYYLYLPEERNNNAKLIEIRFNNTKGNKLTIYVAESIVNKLIPHENNPIPTKTRSLSAPGELTVINCIRSFVEPETIGKNGQWFCVYCQKLTNATKKHELLTLPKYLTLQLKRFNFDSTIHRKIDTFVKYPVKDLDLSEFLSNPKEKEKAIYDLIAVSNHTGSLTGGHYTTVAKNFLDHQWYDFNDSSVYPVEDEKSIVTRNAYLLIYGRKS